MQQALEAWETIFIIVYCGGWICILFYAWIRDMKLKERREQMRQMRRESRHLTKRPRANRPSVHQTNLTSEQTVVCSFCKKELPRGNFVFCPFCGNQLRK